MSSNRRERETDLLLELSQHGGGSLRERGRKPEHLKAKGRLRLWPASETKRQKRED